MSTCPLCSNWCACNGCACDQPCRATCSACCACLGHHCWLAVHRNKHCRQVNPALLTNRAGCGRRRRCWPNCSAAPHGASFARCCSCSHTTASLHGWQTTCCRRSCPLHLQLPPQRRALQRTCLPGSGCGQGLPSSMKRGRMRRTARRKSSGRPSGASGMGRLLLGVASR